MPTPTIPRTICRDCIFATWNKNIQTGCSLNKIEQLSKAGAEIQVVDEDKKQYYAIDGMFCMLCRTDKWAKEQEGIPNWFKSARKEIEITYHAIITDNKDIESTKKTICSLYNQTLKPSCVTVLREPNNPIRPETLMFAMSGSGGIKWNVQNCKKESKDPIDETVYRSPYQYYALFKSGFEVPKQLFAELDKKINDELLRFAIILPNKDGNGMIIPQVIHDFFAGHMTKPLVEKIEENQCAHMIYKANEIFSFFPR